MFIFPLSLSVLKMNSSSGIKSAEWERVISLLLSNLLRFLSDNHKIYCEGGGREKGRWRYWIDGGEERGFTMKEAIEKSGFLRRKRGVDR